MEELKPWFDTLISKSEIEYQNRMMGLQQASFLYQNAFNQQLGPQNSQLGLQNAYNAYIPPPSIAQPDYSPKTQQEYLEQLQSGDVQWDRERFNSLPYDWARYPQIIPYKWPQKTSTKTRGLGEEAILIIAQIVVAIGSGILVGYAIWGPK